ncbi:hypothetical protein D9758_006813 [Tetrapyrgos nigripes]|uniref:Cyclase n=1 Tax=Tetrapyrgos nigripes TaxID=182062 RepID=A0A8H5FU32_9AGAR|nr:hypothetical protein D9758_006813 [Tetrapyrgos nigripes]
MRTIILDLFPSIWVENGIATLAGLHDMASESPFDNVRFPELHELPFKKGNPEGSIWGFYEEISGETKPDELGSLNLLTPRRILRAKEEIQIGKVCSLNWTLQKPKPAGYQRMGLQHRVFKWPHGYIYDDEIHMNTQCGTQLDGQFYNGLSIKDLQDEDGNLMQPPEDKPIPNGIHAFQGKIVGRGVLLDYYDYAESKGISYNINDQHLITAEDLNGCIEAQGVALEPGDILIVRMGYVKWYEHASQEERMNILKGPTKAVGIRQGMEEVKWLWDHHFSVVACDAPAFEVRPRVADWDLHDYLLALWGTPIGELFDLEELSQICKELGRYTFFVTCSPLNIFNGIASPPK